MSGETRSDSRVADIPSRVRFRLETTATLSTRLLRRRDSRFVFVGVTLGYLFAFLYMIQNIFVEFDAGVGVTVPVSDPLSHMFRSAPGQFAFEAVALVELGVVIWLFSPLNTLVGLAIATLVGLNLALTYLAVVQPKACGLGATSGVFASIPALLAGSACCAPVVVLVLGIQMSALLLTIFTWLLPVAIALLLLSLVYVAGKVDQVEV